MGLIGWNRPSEQGAEIAKGVAEIGPGSAFWPVGPKHLSQKLALEGLFGLDRQISQQGACLLGLEMRHGHTAQGSLEGAQQTDL